MPTPYSPSAGSVKPSCLHALTKKSCGICMRMPAPSPVSGSQPQAPRCSRLRRICSPISTMECDFLAAHVDCDEADAEAIAMANDTDFGLAAPTCTAATQRASGAMRHALSRAWSSNRHDFQRGGPLRRHQASGLGREGSHLGIDEYMWK